MKNTLWLCFALLLAACGQNSSSQTDKVPQNATQSIPLSADDTILSEIKTINTPCIAAKPVQKAWKNDTKDFTAKLITICLEDYAIKDTFEHHDGSIEVVRHSNYSYKVNLDLHLSGTKQYIITKDVFADSLSKPYYNGGNLTHLDIISFDSKTLSIQIQGYFGVPDTDDVIAANFRVYYKEGVKFEGFKTEEFDDI